MFIRRIILKLYSKMYRNNANKGLGLKVVYLLFVCVLFWCILILIRTSGDFDRLTWEITNDNSSPKIARLFYESEQWLSNEPAYLYEDLVKENPLGTYFSDRMGGVMPVGKSHLEFCKQNKIRPLKIVLILLRNTSYPSIETLGEFFARQRIEYKFRSTSKDLPPLVIDDFRMPRYSLIVFDDYVTYLQIERSQKNFLDSYCKTYNIAMLILSHDYEDVPTSRGKFLNLKRHVSLKYYKLNPEVNFWRVAKSNRVYTGVLPSSDWTVFISKHVTYRPLALSSVSGLRKDAEGVIDLDCVIGVHDQGFIDGIQRIFLGSSLDFWLNSLVATDAITYLTNGHLSLPLTRYLQVDIDDMFVGHPGIRPLVKDAKAMLASQKTLQEYIPEFKYNLGFCGDHFRRGNEEEQAGFGEVVAAAHQFMWFDHLFRHDKLLNYNNSQLRDAMDRNTQYAQENNIPVTRDYMVPPYHAGVYPVYEVLYDEWAVSGVTSTSTMEYPKESPVWGRRGFIYRGVMTMPRVDCNLYTTVNNFEDIVGGKAKLDKSIRGGSLFQLFLHMPVLVFMTHMPNFANDQLGEYSFQSVVEFVTRWTNLRLEWAPPSQVATRYFQLYPAETTPLWTNPCEYNIHHLEILPPDIACSKFPAFFIIGPADTETTWLQNLLQLHPNMMSITSQASNFFSGQAYQNGLAWYQKQFPETGSAGALLFERSGSYFHDQESPMRIRALVPKSSIVILLSDPVVGAYWCYQNLKEDKGFTRQNYTISEALGSEDATSHMPGSDMRATCLKPRAYAVHLARWLQFFQQTQIFIIDVVQLRKDPTIVLGKLQRFLNADPYTDFAARQRCNSTNTCTDPADSRYHNLTPPPDQSREMIDSQSRRLLQDYFKDHNKNLEILLQNINQHLPPWLSES